MGRIGQGSQIHPDQGRISPRLLAEAQLPQAPQEALRRRVLSLTPSLRLNPYGEPGRSGYGVAYLSAVLHCVRSQYNLASSICLDFLCVIPDHINKINAPLVLPSSFGGRTMGLLL